MIFPREIGSKFFIFLLMKNNSNWFESPHPTSFNFAQPHSNKDQEPEEEIQLRVIPTPFPLARHHLSPFIQYQQQRVCPLGFQAKDNEEQQMRPMIMNRLVFSSEDEDDQLLTPSRANKIQEQIHTTARKSDISKMLLPRRSRPKQKGLRGISYKAYAVVLDCKETSYKEVANRLLKQFSLARQLESPSQETNVKRRVYDALNVLIAVGVLRKQGRKIINEKQSTRNPLQLQEELQILKRKMMLKQQMIKEKRKKLQESQKKLRGVRQLLRRNLKNKELVWSTGSYISFPFIGVAGFSAIKEILREDYFQAHFDVMVRPFGDMDSLSFL